VYPAFRGRVPGSNPGAPTSPAIALSDGGLFYFRSFGASPDGSKGYVGQCPKKLKNRCMWFVYILKCTVGSIYIGCTSDLDDRLHRHQSGFVPASKGRLPVELITYIAFNDK
jgi:hypothetical protein